MVTMGKRFSWIKEEDRATSVTLIVFSIVFLVKGTPFIAHVKEKQKEAGASK